MTPTIWSRLNDGAQSMRFALVVSTCCLVASAIVVPIASTQHNQPPEPMELAALLRRLGETYSAMTVYRDKGASTVHSPTYPQLNATQVFTTEFERSKRFSWVSDLGKKNDYRITFDGLRTVEQSYGRRKAVSNLGEAIAGATGISNVAATWVPTLLMPDVLPGVGLLPAFERASLATRLPDSDAGGQRCFVLRAQDNRLEIRVWISQRDFLLRRVEHRSAGRDPVTTTDYTPQTDIPLTP